MSTSILNASYEMAPDPPAPMAWKDYAQIATRELTAVLTDDAAEGDVQTVLERHPCLVPGSGGLPLTSPSGHGPFPAALISQPPLPSYGGQIPDFMWITTDSVMLSPVLIEIERPGKHWFTKSGQQAHQLTQALDQLQEWRAWFEPGHRKEEFCDFYQIDDGLRRRKFAPQFLLIYGRRAESTRNESVRMKRAYLQSDDQSVVSFDRLTPAYDASQYMSVRIDHGAYRAISVPPTIELGPLFARSRSVVMDKEAAVGRNAYLTAARKTFLCARLVYWDAWAGSESRLMNLGDRE